MKKMYVLWASLALGALSLSINNEVNAVNIEAASEYVSVNNNKSSVPLIKAQTDAEFDANYNDPTNLLVSKVTDKIKWYVGDDNVLYFGRGEFSKFPVGATTAEKKVLKGVVGIEFSQKATGALSLNKAFSNLTIEYIHGFENLDTSKTTNMSYMFEKVLFIEALDLSSLDTSQVTNMSYMFYVESGISRLSELDVSTWNTSKVTNMAYLFSGLRHLEKLDVSNWDVRKVTNMSYMLSGLRVLREIDVSKWSVSHAPKVRGLFFYTGLVHLDLNSWDVSKWTSIYEIFEGMASLKTLGISEWDTSSMTDIQEAFKNTYSLETIDVEDWDVSNVVSMSSLFGGSASVTKLDLSKWDLTKVKTSYNMFDTNSNLKELILGPKFRVPSKQKPFNKRLMNYSPENGGWHNTNNPDVLVKASDMNTVNFSENYGTWVPNMSSEFTVTGFPSAINFGQVNAGESRHHDFTLDAVNTWPNSLGFDVLARVTTDSNSVTVGTKKLNRWFRNVHEVRTEGASSSNIRITFSPDDKDLVKFNSSIEWVLVPTPSY